MGFKILFGTVIGALTLSFNTVLEAADLSVERDVLLRLQQVSENQQLSLQDKEQSLLDFERKLLDAQNDLADAERELLEKEQELATASAGGEEMARKRKLAEHAVSMAKRSVKNRHKRIQRIEGKLTQEQEVLASARAQLSKSRSNIAKQEAKIARLRDQEKARAAQLAKAEQQRRQAKPEPKPQVQQTLAKTQPPVSEPPKLAQVDVPKQEQPKVEEPKPEVPAETPAEDQEAARQMAALDELARKQAQAENQRLNEALSAAQPSGRQLYKNLRIKSDKIEAGFEFLGNHQYRAESVVTGGRHMFKVGSHHYRGTIPSSDEGEVYVFLYDTSRKGKPRLSMYRKSLLQ